MNFSQLVNALLEDCRLSLDMFLPEIVVVAAIVGLLLVRLFGLDRRLPGSVVAVIGTLAALVFAAMQFTEFKDGFVDGSITPVSMFTGLLVYDPFTVFFRLFLLLFVLFVIYLTIISGIPDQEDAPDFYVLLLGSTLGMMLMASANHLLMVFLAVEMTSVPSYAMVGFLKGRKASSEAALKYVVYGAGAAGVMLYGISLLAGLLGTAHLPSMAQALAEFGAHHSGFADPAVRTLALAILMVLVGVAFKLSIFPFHFWCPDAFEGASAEVGGFLSVASKGAAFALLVRVCLALAGQADWGEGALSSLLANVGVGLGVAAAVTATFGNLTAYAQTNIKRMLAYSTIAHAGYMLMAVASLMVVINGPLEETGVAVRRVAAEYAVQGLLYYLVVYFFMNLGAFAVVALIRNAIYSEEIDDYSGLIRQSPFLAICMLVCLFSLIGLPPMGGFVGKLMVFYSLVEAARFQPFMWVILVAGGVNTVFSLFYYMRVVKVMFLGALPERERAVNVSLRSDAGWYMLLVSTPVFLLMIFVEPVSRVASEVARTLFH